MNANVNGIPPLNPSQNLVHPPKHESEFCAHTPKPQSEFSAPPLNLSQNPVHPPQKTHYPPPTGELGEGGVPDTK